MRYFSLGFLLLGCSVSTLAQTHFCIGGELDRMSSAEVSSCQSKMMRMRDAVRHHGAPSGWHFVVVCDESGWKDYASFSGEKETGLTSASFHTDAQSHRTFVRGSRLDEGSRQQTDGILAAALESVPGMRPVPRLLPNPTRVVHEVTLQIAEAIMPDAKKQPLP